jgi:Ca-activated chloride channel family protein
MRLLFEYFETPALFLHLALIAVLAGLWVVSVRQRRRRLAGWPRILRLSDGQRRGWRRRLGLNVLGLTCVVVALAGPFGGQAEPIKVVPGRDLMIVLDVSRSMAAEQPSRLEKAVRSLRTLTVDKRLPPGTRVSLVVFGARPWLSFPLTADLAHLAATLDQVGAGEFPLEVRGDAQSLKSGTRLGAALKLATESFGAPRPGRQDIVLLSDGDDPEGDDEEWLQGVTVARTTGLPVHVVAVGERGVKATIPYRGDVVRFEGAVVTTSVHSERLEEVADKTGGLLLTLERGELPLADFIAKRWAETPPPEEGPILRTSTDVRPVRRFPWLLAALAAFVVANADRRLSLRETLDGERRASAVRGSESRERTLEGLTPSARRFGAALLSLALVSAEFELAGMAELRRGQEAFQRQEFTEALDWFEKAQPLLADPGLAAFNRGAAHFRLKNFGEAARAYRQALADNAIADARRDRALFDLGNSLLEQGGLRDRRLVEEAIDAYKKCLAAASEPTLKRDAEFNLAIAGQRLLRIQPPPPDPPGSDQNPRPRDPKDPGNEDPAMGKKELGTPNGGTPNGSNEKNPGRGDPKQKLPATGQSSVLPERPPAETLTPEQVAAALAAHVARISQDRLRERHERDVLAPQGKDW